MLIMRWKDNSVPFITSDHIVHMKSSLTAQDLRVTMNIGKEQMKRKSKKRSVELCTEQCQPDLVSPVLQK